MGLLEKALKYKNEMNKRGTETLIDRIAGPAATGFQHDQHSGDHTSNESSEKNSESPLNAAKINKEPEKISGLSDVENGSPDLNDGDDNIYFLTGDDLQEIEADQPEPSGRPGHESDDTDTSPFSDYLILYETVQEILNAKSFEELTDVILFLAMGQMASSSSSILLPDQENDNRWIIADSRGIKTVSRDITFDSGAGLILELHNRNSIIDIDAYRKITEFSSDYIKFISIDTRIIVPLIYENEITGILTLGEKISEEEYSPGDFKYLDSLGKTAALALRNIKLHDWSYREISNIEAEITKSDSLNSFIKEIYKARGSADVNGLLKKYFADWGYNDFVIYIKPEIENRFIPFAGNTIYHSAVNLIFNSVDDDAPFIRSLQAADETRDFDCGPESPAYLLFEKKYSEGYVNIHVFPVHENLTLRAFIGFLDSADKKNVIDNTIINTVKHPVTAALHNAYVSESGSYIKSFNAIVEKINREIKRAEALSMPFSLAMITIKNFKRLFNSLGVESANEFFLSMEELASKRISDGDTFFRYDKNSLLLLLPGKEKKYASALANSIKSELNSFWPDSEGTPLVTVLISQFPADADNVYSLLDLIE